MRQSAELFGMMSHRFQIDESQIRETVSLRPCMKKRRSSCDLVNKIIEPRTKSGLQTGENFPD